MSQYDKWPAHAAKMNATLRYFSLRRWNIYTRKPIQISCYVDVGRECIHVESFGQSRRVGRVNAKKRMNNWLAMKYPEAYPKVTATYSDIQMARKFKYSDDCPITRHYFVEETHHG